MYRIDDILNSLFQNNYNNNSIYMLHTRLLSNKYSYSSDFWARFLFKIQQRRGHESYLNRPSPSIASLPSILPIKEYKPLTLSPPVVNERPHFPPRFSSSSSSQVRSPLKISIFFSFIISINKHKKKSFIFILEIH